MGRFQYLLFVLVLLAPVAALAVSWFQDGWYEGLRDRRLFSTLIASFSFSFLSCAFLLFLVMLATLACCIAGLLKRPGIMAVSWMTWFVPREALAVGQRGLFLSCTRAKQVVCHSPASLSGPSEVSLLWFPS